MTCSNMLDQMLEAELDELAGVGSSPVSVHVRECARCRAIADHLSRDTYALALALPPAAEEPRIVARDVRPISRRWGRATTLGLAAVLALMIGRRWIAPEPPATLRSTEASGKLPALGAVTVNAPSSRSAASVARQPMQAAGRTSPSARRSATLPDRVGLAGQTRVKIAPLVARAVDGVAMQRATAISPVRFDVRQVGSLGSPVTADPPAGVQANVIRTSTPGVTVVWLYH